MKKISTAILLILFNSYLFASADDVCNSNFGSSLEDCQSNMEANYHGLKGKNCIERYFKYIVNGLSGDILK